MNLKRRVGIVGYGKLGQFLAKAIQEREEYQLAFVWNRNPDGIGPEIPEDRRLVELKDFRERKPDLIVEVAHPVITQQWGEAFLEYCDYMSGSPTAFAELKTEQAMRATAAIPNGHGLYIPRGALPGLGEVLGMKSAGKLSAARITMRKHPSSLKYSGPIDPPMEETTAPRVIYDGPLRPLCGFAPNNVNTMAVLALASELGFDKLEAQLVANPNLEHHITEVVLLGPDTGGPRYSLTLLRESPAGAGAVTSTATLTTFCNSMFQSVGQGDGVHFC